MEENLAASEAKLRALFASMQDVVLVIDRDGVYCQIAPTNPGLLARQPEELLGKNLRDFFPARQAESLLETTRQVLDNRQTARVEYEMMIDERALWFSTTISPMNENCTVWVAHEFTNRKRMEESLQNSEIRLTEAQKLGRIGSWMFDVETREFVWSDEVYKLFERDLSLGPPTEAEEAAYYSADQARASQEYFRRAISEGLDLQYDLETNLPSGRTAFFSFLLKPTKDKNGHITRLFGTVQEITERKRAELELKKVNKQLRTLTNYWQTSIETERTTIAREIHDDFGQSMTALKMDLTWLENRLPKGDKRIERIQGMNKLVDDSITLMRRIATQLRPNLLDDLGLDAALEWQAKEFSRRSGIRCELNLPEIDLGLNPSMSTSVFRIFQESLTNINRHAQATQVTVTLEQKDWTMVLTIQDDGHGIIEKEITASHSLGLLGMRERAAQWGGEVNIQGVSGKGTTVTVRIPLPVSTVEGGKQ